MPGDRGRGPEPLGSLCGRVRLSVLGFVGLGSGRASVRAFECSRLRVAALRRGPRPSAPAWVWVGARSVSAYAVRAVYVSGWVTEERVRAGSRTPPQLPAPPRSFSLQTFLRVPRATASVLPVACPEWWRGLGVLADPLVLISGGPLCRQGLGED